MKADTIEPPIQTSYGPPKTPASRRPPRKGLKLAGIVALGVAIAVVVVGIRERADNTTKLTDWTKAQAIPSVAVIEPKPDTASQPLILPGILQADYNAEIYSRVSGYVQAWYVDIGAPVKAGQLLATIDTPELDQQLIQARANLASAQANMQLARTTAQRWATLLVQDAVSKQESEEKAGDLAAKTAMVNAAQANVNRLMALKSFSKITAPFDGIVTARRTDIGHLVNAGAGASAHSELFDVAEISRLRLYVHVPQSYSARIREGMNANLTVPEYPGRTFKATLVSTSDAVNESSGTVLVELMVDNAGHALKPGDYAQVTFNLPSIDVADASVLSLPASALLFRDAGLQTAVVDADNRVELKKVSIDQDLGETVDIGTGLKPTDHVIDNPPDSIADGDQVKVVPSTLDDLASNATD